MNVQLEADSAGDGTNITARLRGSYDNATWENVGSAVVWYLASADTIIKINSFSYAESLTSDTTGYKKLFSRIRNYNKNYTWINISLFTGSFFR